MEQRHRHHINPRHKGGTDDSENIIEIDFVEHARIHAERFLAGEDNWFDCRQPGWPHLSLELRQAVSNRIGEINKSKSGENHPSYGRNIHSKEFRERRSKEITGAGNPRYGSKLSEETKEKIRKAATGRKHSEEARAKMSAARKGKKRGPYKKKNANRTGEGPSQST